MKENWFLCPRTRRVTDDKIDVIGAVGSKSLGCEALLGARVGRESKSLANIRQ
jgi:hypothetical protein